MTTYKLSSESVKKSFNQGGSRITETGAYDGQFTLAKAIETKKGTKGIEFTFKADDGKEAKYLTLYTHKADGSEIFGFDIVNAIMYCLKLKSIESAKQTIKQYDFELKSEVDVEAEVFPQLTNKSIGLVLQAEEYEKNNGMVGIKMNIVLPYMTDTRKTAIEGINGTEAKMLDELLETITDKKMSMRAKHGEQNTTLNEVLADNAIDDDFVDDDDIPF